MLPEKTLQQSIAEASATLGIAARERLPERAQRLAVEVQDNFKLPGSFIDVFDGVLRHINHVLVGNGCCTEGDSGAPWPTVSTTIGALARSAPPGTPTTTCPFPSSCTCA